MAAFNSTDYDAMLKDYYTEEMVVRMSLVDNPLLGMLPKKRAGGRRWIQPVNFKHPGGASATFATARANQSGSQYNDFQIPITTQYQIVTLANQVYFQSEGDMDAFEPAFNEFDKGFEGLAQKINARLYRDSAGTIGQILDGTAINGATLQLADPADAFNFWPEDLIVFSATAGSALRDGGQALLVVSVDREVGIVTFDTADASADITGLTDTDFMYIEGDRNACSSGLASWLPAGTTRDTQLAATFLGVTRSVDPQLLGGIYYDGSTGDLNDTFLKLVGKVGKYGGKPDLVIMNTEQLTNLQRLWVAKRVDYQDITVSVSVRMKDGSEMILTNIYSGMQMQVGQFKVKILGDRACPSTLMYCLTTRTWRVWHTFDLPGFVMNKEGGRIIKDSEDEDAMECRVGAYFNLGCEAPGYNGVALLPADV